MAVEIAWFESTRSEVFGQLIVDRDREFSGIVFVADLDGRYRWASQTDHFTSTPDAVEALGDLAAVVLADIEAFREQGERLAHPLTSSGSG